MTQCGRILHAVKNGSDEVIKTSNLQDLLNKQNENTLTALLTAQVNFFVDDLAITCTSVIPESEEQTGRITQKIDTVIMRFHHSPLTRILTGKEIGALLERANNHYGIIRRMLQFQTANNIDIKNTDILPTPTISLEV